jgi:membrane-associated phospholipid phosphatase
MLVISVDKFSFPSGHASRCSLLACLAFACTRSLAAGDPLAAAVALWALCTAVSRVALGRHYVGDVVTGVALGVLEFGIVAELPHGYANVRDCMRR